LADATGWQPEIPLSQTIADMFDYWRSKPDDAVLS
jgi:GDP-4-dehydro-6-deoxy-D-mannose reductase